MSFLDYLASKIAEHLLRRKLGPKIKPLRWYDLFAFLGSLLFLIGLALVFMPLVTTADTTPFLENGIEDTATITKLEIEKRPLGFRGLTSSNEYIVHLIYIPGTTELNTEAFDFDKLLKSEGESAYISSNETKTITTRTEIHESTFQALTEEQEVAILYLPENLEKVMLLQDLEVSTQQLQNKGNNWLPSTIILVIGLLCLIVWKRISKKYIP